VAELEREMIDVGGRETAVITGGSGDALVFLHGGGIVEGFDCFAPLTEHFRFIAPLMPGYDRTALRPAIRSIDELVEHTSRVLDELGVGDFVLVGFSIGGWVAASLAAAHPERVRKLVISSAYGVDDPDHPVADIASMAPGEIYNVLTREPAVFTGRLPHGEDPAFDAARALEAQSLAGFVPGPFDPALPAKLERLTMPILLTWGEDDQLTPVARLEAWRAALPQAQARVFPFGGHLLFHEQREAVDAIGDFAAV
jgi:pimeloyl-ACP methyl ester carboxylesterase